MMPSSYPLTLYHGDSYQWQFKLWQDTGKTQPLDLTDVQAKAEIRDKPGGLEVYQITCEISLPNVIAASLSAAVCRSLPLGNMVWDLQLTYSTGSVNTILSGSVSVAPDVTDSAEEAPEVLAAGEPIPIKRPPMKAPRVAKKW